jgi:hypothetical protein
VLPALFGFPGTRALGNTDVSPAAGPIGLCDRGYGKPAEYYAVLCAYKKSPSWATLCGRSGASERDHVASPRT